MKSNGWWSLKKILLVVLTVFVVSSIALNFTDEPNWLLFSIAGSLGSLIGILLAIELASLKTKIWLSGVIGLIMLAIIGILLAFITYISNSVISNSQTIFEINTFLFYFSLFLIMWFFIALLYCYPEKEKDKETD